jgi:zinc transporter ZupT
MDVARKLGILVFCAVPAVVGGGIVYAAFESLTALFIFQVVLLAAAGAFVSR